MSVNSKLKVKNLNYFKELSKRLDDVLDEPTLPKKAIQHFLATEKKLANWAFKNEADPNTGGMWQGLTKHTIAVRGNAHPILNRGRGRTQKSVNTAFKSAQLNRTGARGATEYTAKVTFDTPLVMFHQVGTTRMVARRFIPLPGMIDRTNEGRRTIADIVEMVATGWNKYIESGKWEIKGFNDMQEDVEANSGSGSIGAHRRKRSNRMIRRGR